MRTHAADRPSQIGAVLWTSADAANDVSDLIEQTRTVRRLGVDTVWFKQMFDLDSLSLAAVVGAAVPGTRVGTSIVPINPRHPLVVANQAQTAQAAAHGGFTLGLGLGAPALEAEAYGVREPRPILRLREYLTVLRQLFDKGGADFRGESVTTHPPMPTVVRGGEDVPILVAAMGKQALAVSGELADGVITFLAGPRAIGDHVVPRLERAAERQHRVVASVIAVVTDEPDRVREHATSELALYETIPSYQRILAEEGAARAAELVLIGDEQTVATGLRRYLDAGATELAVTQMNFASPQERIRTWTLLGSLQA
ncbi:TIGR03564 family F420-dependent LLM class oxidoreductase [Streptomyces sp. NPDC097610]|uniref:TIGR03564 family F420-dependent LLM class oxidoreductase n=1 Tax=Streptomyces sp. NPDC097610 TaxID=3157227 RepID=UPI00332BE739